MAMEAQPYAVTDLALPGPPPTSLLIASFQQSGPFKEQWPNHHYCELVYALEGKATWDIDGRTYDARPGRALLIKAKRSHSTTIADDLHLRGIVIHFMPNALSPCVERIDVDALAQWEDADSRTLGRLFEWCLQENLEMRAGAHRVADSLLNIILVECVRTTGGSGLQHEGAPSSSLSMKRISSACSKYIGEHFHEQLTLTKVAHEICISPFYLSHVFSKYTGITFTEYLTDIRMDHARVLLTQTDLSICQVADRVGYPDVYYFSKVFKKRFAAPPGRYRKGVERQSV